MKVWIREPHDWFGPYQLAELLMFWCPKEKDEWGFPHTAERVHHFGEWLAHGSIEPEPEVGSITKWNQDRHETWLYKFLLWVDKQKQKIPRVMVKIDRYDTWSMDHTLAPIVLPMLKQLRETTHGSQFVDLEDVPEYMRTTTHETYDEQKSFEFYHEDKEGRQYDIHDRWKWCLDEMIYSFDSIENNWEDKYHKGIHDIRWKKLDNGMSQMIRGENDTHHFDYEGYRKECDRIQHGFYLFGKYFRGLWD